jgi:hypothetical protein
LPSFPGAFKNNRDAVPRYDGCPIRLIAAVPHCPPFRQGGVRRKTISRLMAAALIDLDQARRPPAGIVCLINTGGRHEKNRHQGSFGGCGICGRVVRVARLGAG